MRRDDLEPALDALDAAKDGAGDWYARADALLAENPERCWAECVLRAIHEQDGLADPADSASIPLARACIPRGSKLEACWCGCAEPRDA